MEESPENHLEGLYRFALRLTGDRNSADDLTQEAFLRAWRHRKRLRAPRAMRIWLFRIARNLWMDQLRRARVRGREERLSPESAGPPDGRRVEGNPGAEEEVRLVIRAMDTLPPRQRQVLYLSAFEGLSGGEIAGVLEIGEGAVRTSLCLARKALREKLDRVHPGGTGG